jgi:hypothetical protein
MLCHPLNISPIYLSSRRISKFNLNFSKDAFQRHPQGRREAALANRHYKAQQRQIITTLFEAQRGKLLPLVTYSTLLKAIACLL